MMRLYFIKVLLICAVFFWTQFNCNAQDTTVVIDTKPRGKWILALPLRFTHLQNNNTMLSGIKAGRRLNSKVSVAISIYHSFYLNSFKSKANLPGFDKQPQLFINCMGLEVQYDFYSSEKLTAGLQLLGGWGFMKYDLKDHHFKSKQLNYLAFEPSFNMDYNVNVSTALGLGIGYRPILNPGNIRYSSLISNGNIPVNREFPNGINILLSVKGYF